jgi:dolichol-phosphate mannosyltransferase
MSAEPETMRTANQPKTAIDVAGSMRVPQLFVVLPAYNEEGAIEPLLDKVLAMVLSEERRSWIIVVDDGSTDGTAAAVSRYSARGVSLVQHPQNKGLHEAVRTGILYALEHAGPQDALVTLDSDNTHHPDLIPAMLEELERGADVVIASRFAPGGRMVGAPLIRHVYSFGAGLLLRLRFPIAGVRDYTCGYRAYRASILKQAFDRWGDEFINVPGFSCMLDILLRLRSLGARIVEVPLVLRYDLKVSPSKLRVLRTIGNTIKLAVTFDRA